MYICATKKYKRAIRGRAGQRDLFLIQLRRVDFSRLLDDFDFALRVTNAVDLLQTQGHFGELRERLLAVDELHSVHVLERTAVERNAEERAEDTFTFLRKRN